MRLTRAILAVMNPIMYYDGHIGIREDIMHDDGWGRDSDAYEAQLGFLGGFGAIDQSLIASTGEPMDIIYLLEIEDLLEELEDAGQIYMRRDDDGIARYYPSESEIGLDEDALS